MTFLHYASVLLTHIYGAWVEMRSTINDFLDFFSLDKCKVNRFYVAPQNSIWINDFMQATCKSRWRIWANCTIKDIQNFQNTNYNWIESYQTAWCKRTFFSIYILNFFSTVLWHIHGYKISYYGQCIAHCWFDSIECDELMLFISMLRSK